MNENTDLLVWDKKFELGIPVIDSQHEHLVELCNTLYRSIIHQQKAGAEHWQIALSEALRETAGYIVIHFRDEEKLMKAAGYENFGEHRARHQEFISKVTDTITNFDKATFQTAFDFVKFLYDWILRHIAYEDKLYVKAVVEFSKQRNQKS